MSPEENKANVRRYLEEWSNREDPSVVEEVIAPEWVSHGTQSFTATPSGLPRGVAGVKQLHDEVRAIWPDNRWTIDDMLAEGDRVAVRMTNRATHRGTYRGIPPTGKVVTFSAIWIYRVVDGKIVEAWRSADDLGRVVQIGGRIVPSQTG
jgi:predicted ester cyclase